MVIRWSSMITRKHSSENQHSEPRKNTKRKKGERKKKEKMNYGWASSKKKS
jgi:hypothetical protein